MDIFFCLRSWDDTLDLDLRCLGCTAVIIPEMLLYADKAIELGCRSQAVEYMCGHDINLVRYLLELKLRQWQAEDLSC